MLVSRHVLTEDTRSIGGMGGGGWVGGEGRGCWQSDFLLPPL